MIAGQHGLVTRGQALGAGLTSRQVDHRVRTGEWVRVRPRVYRHCAHRPSREQALLAAVLALGEGVAVSHRAALGLWGLHGFRSSVLEVSQARVGRRAPDGVILHRAVDLGPGHITRQAGVPVTTRVRTLVDLGAVVPERLVTRAMEEWLADRLVTIDQLRDAVAHHGGHGRRGVGVLRRVLDERVLIDAIADSGTEALLARVLADRGVPPPAHHHLTHNAELDYAYPDARIAIEVDGYGVHLRSRETFEHDRHRQNELEIAGWRVLRFTSHALHDHPDRVAGQVRRLLAKSTTPSPMPFSTRDDL